MKRTFLAKPGERGIALVMALVSLLVVAVIAVVLMMSLSIERKISGNDLRDSQSMNLAEAGVGEAMSRIRNFDISLPPANPRAVAQIFLTNAGSVPVLGTDSVAIEIAHARPPSAAAATMNTPTGSASAKWRTPVTTASAAIAARIEALRRTMTFCRRLPDVWAVLSTGTPYRPRLFSGATQP